MSAPVALFFGAWSPNNLGHCLFDTRGGTLDCYKPPLGCPWNAPLMDGGLLKNGKHPDQVTGKVWWTCGGGEHFWHAFIWWDRSGDSRGNSNSGFYVRGFGPIRKEDPFEIRSAPTIDAFRFACTQFPKIVARQNAPLVLQIQKEPTP